MSTKDFEIMDEVQSRQVSEPVENVYQTKQVKTIPPEGFMTGDEFERRVKEELKQLYKEHGLL
jgi:hypothetical protein